MNAENNNLFVMALHCLKLDDIQEKLTATKQLQQLLLAESLNFQPQDKVETLKTAGRPEKPQLVDARDVPRRNFNSLKGRLTLVHAIAHIEFNAINLALDAVYRFQDMPEQYYQDWCRVAAEEALHYSLLSGYLESHGMSYGDLPAHNGLWEMAVKTDSDVLVRMALVPRVLEARGLDVTPTMIKKLKAIADTELVEILEKIFIDEIGHVKIGSHWFNLLCEQRKLDSRKTFLHLIDQYMQGAKFGPFETEARLQAGFTAEEMQELLDRF
jgi:uncharacterized ferritin-like protein (DUF455 family)